MVALIELLLGLFLAALLVLELTGRTDFLGRRKRREFAERQERQLAEESDERDDGPQF